MKNGSFVSLYDNVTTHDGDLVIDGTQVFVIENCKYVQNGNIYVREEARLWLKNATLLLVMQYDFQFNIQVSEHATVDVNASIIETEKRVGTILSFDDTRVSVANSTLDDVQIDSWGDSFVEVENSTFFELFLHEASQVLIENSVVTWVVNLSFDFPQLVDLYELKGGYQKNWNLHKNQTVQNVLYDLTVKNSVIAWGLVISDNATVKISNCGIERVMMYLHSATRTLKNAQPGYCEEMIFDSILLQNSSVRFWQVGFTDTSISVENCQLGLDAFGSSSINITNSLVGWFRIWPDSNTRIDFDAAILTNYLAIIDSTVYACGNATFSINSLSFVSSDFTRNYNILAEDRSGNPMDNVELALFDNSNEAIWIGLTDGVGKANSNVTFTDSNYTDKLRLDVFKEGFYNETKIVGFLSDTPVSVVLIEKIPGDINLDRGVGLVDLVLLAKAYGSKLGDSNWNPNADVDGNGAVGLSDLVALAQHYGQHYP
jgi:hypothetical protein